MTKSNPKLQLQTLKEVAVCSQYASINARLNSKAQIDTSTIYYKDSEYNALGGVDACVKDAVTKNRFSKDGTFFKNFTAGSSYLAVGYRYNNGTYGLIVLYKFGMKLDYRYSIESGIFSKIS